MTIGSLKEVWKWRLCLIIEYKSQDPAAIFPKK